LLLKYISSEERVTPAMIGFFIFSFIIGGITYYLIPEEGGLARTVLACLGALIAGFAVSIVVGSLSLGRLGISINGAIVTPMAVLGVLAARLRDRRRLKQREQKNSPSDLRSR
jgi:hypothetical protein